MLHVSRKHSVLLLSMTTVVALFLILSAPARSFSLEAKPGSVSVSLRTPVSRNNDVCLAQLQTAREQADRQNAVYVVQQDAGHAAALSLMLGVRYAVGPMELNTRTPIASSTLPAAYNPALSGQHAVAVAQYRHCRNQQALKSL